MTKDHPDRWLCTLRSNCQTLETIKRLRFERCKWNKFSVLGASLALSRVIFIFFAKDKSSGETLI